MKSIKPGRGPSMMGAVGSVLAAIFGVAWIIGAVTMGAPLFFAIFGVVFVCIAIVQAVYNFKNATGEHRYSSFDIVDSEEEPDPLQQRVDHREPEAPAKPAAPRADGYCPYCGTPTGSEFEFCPKCGKRLPR